VFLKGGEKRSFIFLKILFSPPPPPPHTPYNVETLEKCPTLYGEGGGGAEQV